MPISDHPVSRRRVVQGVAWAAPAIVLATAIPAAASSDGGAQLGYLSFTTNTVKVDTVAINDLNWATKPILLIDPDITNLAPPGGPSVTGTALSFSIPKAWLPNGTLGWHGAYNWLAGGGTPNDFVVSVAEGTSAYTFLLQTVTVLGANSNTSFSPEYRIELSPSASLVGQTLVMRAAGNANGTAWGTNTTATVA